MIRIKFGDAYPGAGGIRLDEHHADAIDFAHAHDFYEIFVVTNGRVLHEMDGRADPLPAGRAAFIRPRDVHRFDRVEGELYAFINIPFTPAAFRAAIAYLDAAERAEALCARAEPPEATLNEEALNALARDVRECGLAGDRDRFLRALLARLLVECFLREEDSPALPLPGWLNALLTELKHPANFRRGVAGLYETTGLSPSHLSRAFRKHLGMTPTEYLNRLRIDYARYLLKYTGRAVVDVAMECGFENLSHFYHLFGRAENAAPAAYRRAFRRMNEAGE